MATEAILKEVARAATSDLSGKQFYAAILDTSGGLSLAASGKNADGILQDKPKSGEAGTLAVFGISKAAITASQAITIGQLLQVDTAGTLIGVSSGTVVAKALEALSSTASVCIITVLILKSNAVFS